MRLKRIMALALAGVMATSLVSCSGGEKKSTSGTKVEQKDDGKLVVWTLAADLQQFADKFKEEKGIDVSVTVIEPAEYTKKVDTALQAGESEPDIIVGEPQMLQEMYEKEFFASLDEFGAQDYKDDIVDYVWEVGQSEDGVQRAISYQITPAGFYYRRSIAKKVFGTDDPEEIGKLFESNKKILETAETLKKAGYKIFASDAETNYFSGDEAWVIDNKLNLAQQRLDYMDLCVDLYQKDYTAFAAQWAAPWYLAMSGPVPQLTAETQWGVGEEGDVWDKDKFAAATEGMATTEVFAYGLPSWGVLTLRDNVGETSGDWGVCSGPAYGFGGGTYIGISALSKRQKTAWDFVKFCTLTDSTLEWWLETSQGDTVSYKPVLDKHKEDENPVYGGQKLYSFWLEQAEGIDYSKVTKYDKAIGDAWGAAISSVKEGKATKEEAIQTFYDDVHSAYPDLEIDR